MVAQQQQPAVRQGIPAHLTPLNVNMHKAYLHSEEHRFQYRCTALWG